MKILIVFTSVILFSAALPADTILSDLPRLNRPNDLVVEGDRVYISDCPQVHIYALKNSSLVYLESFGRAGMGPGEFEPNHANFNVYITGDRLFVYSRAKVAYYTREGELIRELNTLSVARVFVPVKDRLVARRLYMDGQTRMRGIILYDAELKPLKTLSEQVYVQQLDNSRIKAYSNAYSVATSWNRIFTATSDTFVINVYDIDGNLVHTINQPDTGIRVRITASHRRGLHDYLKRVSANYPGYKHRLVFAEYFPAIRNGGLAVDDSSQSATLIAVTWKNANGRILVYRFSESGKLLDKLWLPLVEQNPVRLYPFCIRQRHLYQLVENPESETYELHMTAF